MSNAIIDQNTDTVNLDALFQKLENLKMFFVNIDYRNGDDIRVSWPDHLTEKSHMQRFRHHGPRKYIHHVRHEWVYSSVKLTRAQARALNTRFWHRLDKAWRESGETERDNSGNIVRANLSYC